MYETKKSGVCMQSKNNIAITKEHLNVSKTTTHTDTQSMNKRLMQRENDKGKEKEVERERDAVWMELVSIFFNGQKENESKCVLKLLKTIIFMRCIAPAYTRLYTAIIFLFLLLLLLFHQMIEIKEKRVTILTTHTHTMITANELNAIHTQLTNVKVK